MYEGIRSSTFIRGLKNLFINYGVLFYLLGCNGLTEVDPSKSGRSSLNTALAGTNQAYIYPDNPYILEGKFVTRASFKGHLQPQFITDSIYLETRCNYVQYSPDFLNPDNSIPFQDTSNDECIRTLNDQSTTTEILQSENQSWVKDFESDDFYQVNTFYHINKISQRFLESLSFTHRYTHLDSNLTLPPATKYNMVDTGTYWLVDSGITKTLNTYSNCFEGLNAFFSPAQDILCFGYEADTTFRMVQDPTIIYHEAGHAFVKIMMNQRNVTSGVDPNTFLSYFESHEFESDLGEIFYDEAGAINEAIADWFSYYMNARPRVGEFTFHSITNRYDDFNLGSYRPLSEDEEAHSAAISKTSGERLSYPDFLHYDPANPTFNIEDVHYASGIISHYLVSLTEELKTTCSFDTIDEDEIHDQASDYVLLLINETLAEVGDLTGKGSDFFSQYATLNIAQENVYFTNLNENHSYLWTQTVNPPNFRRFFRIFGKNILHYISSGLCPNFSLDESEQLLDEYGLLLFKSYEDRGNGFNTNSLTNEIYAGYYGSNLYSSKTFIPYVFNTEVNEDNRRNSNLISKDFLELDEDSIAFVIDGQNDIRNLLANLTFEGEQVQISEGLAGPEYNNNNIKISPGEIVALSLNIYNNSNSIMGGVQVLANDWDHMKLSDSSNTYVNSSTNMQGLGDLTITGGLANFEPCRIDGFPTASEGGVTDTSTTTAGNCSYINRTNDGVDTSEVVSSVFYPKYDLDAPQPICLVEFSDDDETKWVAQDFYRNTELGLEDSDCLNNPSLSGENFNPNECLIRALPGADQLILGKIDPQLTWSETKGPDADGVFRFDAGQLALFEVNKWIRPGTKFNCRFRVRFSNCSDCFDDGADEYQDYEYGGSDPYKVINFQFTVLD